jgi:hypothetical protein
VLLSVLAGSLLFLLGLPALVLGVLLAAPGPEGGEKGGPPATAVASQVPAEARRGDQVAADKPLGEGASEAGPFSGPYTYRNLSLFLLHGPDTLPGTQRLLTLQEALESKQASLRAVNSHVYVDNRSNAQIFVQAGDILKGAFQDQAVGRDSLVRPQSSNVPLPSYCVEQGRSGPRGPESPSEWESANAQVPGKDFRISLQRGDQEAIWATVGRTQAGLSSSVQGPVQAQSSPTSLQLTLESPALQSHVQGYVQALSGATKGEEDVLGLVVVINGKIQYADQYASRALFAKLWPKLLSASAVAAVAAEAESSGPQPLPTTEALRRFLAAADAGQSLAGPGDPSGALAG